MVQPDIISPTPAPDWRAEAKIAANNVLEAERHRQEHPSPGAFVVNVSDRCAIALVFIFPFPMCKVGRMQVQGNLFEHMHDLPDPRLPDLP